MGDNRTGGRHGVPLVGERYKKLRAWGNDWKDPVDFLDQQVWTSNSCTYSSYSLKIYVKFSSHFFMLILF
jgi:hypothetical protein